MMTIRRALVLAIAILGIAWGLKLAVGADLIELDTQKRAIGVVMGLVLVLYANAVPKTLEPLTAGRCEPSTRQALQRFSGWILVLAGAAYSVAWAVLPLAYARPTAVLAVVAGLLVVVGRFVWIAVGSGPSQPTASRP